ncbi:MAG TPA: hypothetical protein VH661_01080 [Candidatus Dormibacteraeota bacterium]|nr:hypothetical protein [Candidatus Dormibacteraeota bacterium]
MTEPTTVDQARSTATGPLPLLPRGTVVFADIPVRAIVIDALAPVIGDGTLVVRDGDRGAVVLVRGGDVLDVHVSDGGVLRTGVELLSSLKEWPDASVWAERLESSLVDLSEALLRGATVYDDLRLMWVSWPSLLEDLGQRGGTFVVEITTPVGRGVTCVAAGRQTQSYTDIHPALGDPALLEAMASNHQGVVRVRRVGEASVAAEQGDTTEQSAPDPEPSAEGPDTSTNGTSSTDHVADTSRRWPATKWDPPASESETTADEATPAETQPAAVDAIPDTAWVAPWDTPWNANPAEGSVAVGDAPAAAAETTAVEDRPATWDEFKNKALQTGPPSVAEVLDDLRAIARRRLGLSASRVESILDEGALAKRSLLSVLDEIRSLSIRGVMPSTVREMVDEMAAVAAPAA